jgi:hypothetical protein
MSWVITGSEKTPVDPQFGSVSLLLHGDGTNGSTTITDSSRFANTVTAVGNAQISTAQSKFGGASLFSNNSGNSGSYVNVNIGTVEGSLGLQNFTIELWLYIQALSGNPAILDYRPFGINGAYPTLYLASGNLTYFTASSNQITGGSFGIQQWRHIALTRASGSTRLFIDGSQTGTTYSDTNNYLAPNSRPRLFTVGDSDTVATLNGYIDDLRITKGVARYTANFTPPTAAFPDI